MEGIMGFSGGLDGKDLPANAGDLLFDLWDEKILLEKGMATHASILAWRIS